MRSPRSSRRDRCGSGSPAPAATPRASTTRTSATSTATDRAMQRSPPHRRAVIGGRPLDSVRRRGRRRALERDSVPMTEIGRRLVRTLKERQQDLIGRSEEHTSELQSLAYLVCRLLLEKKKITKIPLLKNKKKK